MKEMKEIRLKYLLTDIIGFGSLGKINIHAGTAPTPFSSSSLSPPKKPKMGPIDPMYKLPQVTLDTDESKIDDMREAEENIRRQTTQIDSAKQKPVQQSRDKPGVVAPRNPSPISKSKQVG